MTNTDTNDKILTAARAMVQARGYNALSFRDVAKAVGVKSASIHYHFPTKGDLGAALARQYTDEAVRYFDSLLQASESVAAGVMRYTDVFRSALMNDNRMCLCGIMAAEHDDLPAEVRSEVDRFTDVNVNWLAAMLAKESKATKGALRERAISIFAAIGGAQLVARGRGDVSFFDSSIAAYRKIGLLP